MKQRILAMFATAVLLITLGGCKDKNENASGNGLQELEQELVGLWYEEFPYEDVTEDGKPFNRALIAVEAKADHTGYIALAVFDDEFNEPLEVYGGPKSNLMARPDGEPTGSVREHFMQYRMRRLA